MRLAFAGHSAQIAKAKSATAKKRKRSSIRKRIMALEGGDGAEGSVVRTGEGLREKVPDFFFLASYGWLGVDAFTRKSSRFTFPAENNFKMGGVTFKGGI